MPATSNATANMSRRQAFNGKGLTFIEMIFDTEVTETATTPDTKDSAFVTTKGMVNKNMLSLSHFIYKVFNQIRIINT